MKLTPTVEGSTSKQPQREIERETPSEIKYRPRVWSFLFSRRFESSWALFSRSHVFLRLEILSTHHKSRFGSHCIVSVVVARGQIPVGNLFWPQPPSINVKIQTFSKFSGANSDKLYYSAFAVQVLPAALRLADQERKVDKVQRAREKKKCPRRTHRAINKVRLYENDLLGVSHTRMGLLEWPRPSCCSRLRRSST